jgi:hypothetical protein
MIIHRFNPWHPDILLTQVWKIGACYGCSFDRSEVNQYRRGGFGNEPLRISWLCDVCANTDSGSAEQYPRNFGETKPIIHMLAYCTNMIIEEIRKR